MCGIGSIICLDNKEKVKKEEAWSLLSSMERRGRDGFGMFCWGGKREWKIERGMNKETVFEKGWMDDSRVVIVCSRAAPLPEGVENVAPVLQGDLVGVLNGTISNDEELVRLCGKEYDSKRVDTISLFDFLSMFGMKRLEDVVGGYAIISFDLDKEVVYIAKNYKTLWWSKKNNKIFVASEREMIDEIIGDEYFGSTIFSRDTLVEVSMSTGKMERYLLKRKVWSALKDLDFNRIVMVCSGGIDSVTASFVAKKVFKKDILLLHFDYGQRSMEKERQAVEKVAKVLGAEYEVIDLSWLGKLGGSPLVDRNLELPRGKLSAESTLCWVPGRNLLFLSIAATLAEAKGIGYVGYGNNMEEEATAYSDNDREFVWYMDEVMKYGTIKGVKLWAGLSRLMKVEIIKLGNKLGVPYEMTWSCDEGFEKPCGVCGCCQTRRSAFMKAGIEDKQEYITKSVVDRYPFMDVGVVEKKEIDYLEFIDKI